MKAVDIIIKKRDKQELSKEEIENVGIVEELLKEQVIMLLQLWMGLKLLI